MKEASLAQWISVEQRGEIHEKIQREVRDLLGIETRIEEGGSGGTLPQRDH